jgi:hypothetical protein
MAAMFRRASAGGTLCCGEIAITRDRMLCGAAVWQASKPRRTYATTKDQGDALERRVVRLLKLAGHANVRRSVFLKDAHGNRSEIDIVYGRLWPRYVECKNYRSGPVPLEDVAKFKSVLELNGISARRGLLVTTSTLVPRAKTIGIATVDGVQLRAWERRAAVAWLSRIVIKLGVVAAAALGLAIAIAPFLAAAVDSAAPPLVPGGHPATAATRQLLELRAMVVDFADRAQQSLQQLGGLTSPQEREGSGAPDRGGGAAKGHGPSAAWAGAEAAQQPARWWRRVTGTS